MRARALCLLAALLISCAQPATPSRESIHAAAQRASQAADVLSQRLTGELAQAMATGGTVEAVSVCKERAPAIASEIRETLGVEIGRTALRVRNPANAPDAWEADVLHRFEQRHAAGEPWTAISEHVSDGARLRWMRPIPMGEMCSACHGDVSTFSDETRQALRVNYPSDQASGFEVGALRGAFTARVLLDDQTRDDADDPSRTNSSQGD